MKRGKNKEGDERRCFHLSVRVPDRSIVRSGRISQVAKEGVDFYILLTTG